MKIETNVRQVYQALRKARGVSVLTIDPKGRLQLVPVDRVVGAYGRDASYEHILADVRAALGLPDPP